MVYKAYDPNVKRTVAIKKIHKELLENSDPRLLEYFKLEAQAAGRLSHPKIVAIYGVGEDDGTPYIVMEYAPGPTLKQCLAEQRAHYDLKKIINIMMQLLDALGHAHAHKVVHRDIKPANIILSDGKIKLTDFGIAKIETSHLTMLGDVKGTPNYMSPEQWRGVPVDHRTDLFSAGLILYELLTGERPFSGDSQITIRHRTLNIDPPPLLSSSQGFHPFLMSSCKRP